MKALFHGVLGGVLFFFLIFGGAFDLGPALAGETLPRSAARRVAQVNLLLGQKRGADAVALLEKATAQGDAHYYLDFLLGNCRLGLDPPDPRRAAQDFVRALEKKEDMAPAWFNLARCRYELGELEGAGEAFERAYDHDKKGATLYYSAAAYGAAGNYSRARGVFSRLFRAHPDGIKLTWKETYVNVLFGLEDYRGALPVMEELCELTRGDRQKKWRGILLSHYLSLGLEKKALDFAHLLTRKEPTEPQWWKALAHVELARYQENQGPGGPRGALTALVIYDYLVPLTPSETRLLAELYGACHIPVRAARTWAQWLETLESSGEASLDKRLEKYHTIALAHLQWGEVDTALEWSRRGVALAGDQGGVSEKEVRKLRRLTRTLEQIRENQRI